MNGFQQRRGRPGRKTRLLGLFKTWLRSCFGGAGRGGRHAARDRGTGGQGTAGKTAPQVSSPWTSGGKREGSSPHSVSPQNAHVPSVQARLTLSRSPAEMPREMSPPGAVTLSLSPLEVPGYSGVSSLLACFSTGGGRSTCRGAGRSVWLRQGGGGASSWFSLAFP